MKILHLASECTPIAKVGGLADVVYGLSGAVAAEGHDVTVMLPKYDLLRYDRIEDLEVAMETLLVPWYEGAVHCVVWSGQVHGRKFLFVDPRSDDAFFHRGGFYGFRDEPFRWAFFCKAALEYVLHSELKPDVLHVHDWQAALTPVLLYEIYAHTGLDKLRICFTIHNFKHQGTEEAEILRATGLNRPDYYFDLERMGDSANPRYVNFMKGGITYSNFVTTVSPHYAWEVRHTEQGFGLGHTLHIHQERFGGILNGLDYDMWNPATDTHIPYNYDADEINDKYGNKQALRERLLLRDTYAPILAYVGRLDAQKGLHLIRHALFHTIGNGGQFVLLGSSPDPAIQESFHRLKGELNDNQDCHIELAFDEDLAHLIYAGADAIVVPSLYEPCGLTQMIGLRYGTVPIVRAIGGLADTVFDWDHSEWPQEDRNGFVFNSPDPAGVEWAINRALGLWNHYPGAFRWMIENGMSQDLSWRGPAEHYINIYDYIRHS